jgi:hypothetical protein
MNIKLKMVSIVKLYFNDARLIFPYMVTFLPEISVGMI